MKYLRWIVLTEARIIVILYVTFTQTLKYYDPIWIILANHTSADLPKILKKINLRDTRDISSSQLIGRKRTHRISFRSEQNIPIDLIIVKLS